MAERAAFDRGARAAPEIGEPGAVRSTPGGHDVDRCGRIPVTARNTGGRVDERES